MGFVSAEGGNVARSMMITLTQSMLVMMRRAKDLIVIVTDDLQHGRQPKPDMIAEINMLSVILKAQTNAIRMVNMH